MFLDVNGTALLCIIVAVNAAEKGDPMGIRIAIVFIFIAVGAGCGASSKRGADRAATPDDFAPHDNDLAPYATGFMEGYAAARPDQRIGPTDQPPIRAERRGSHWRTEAYRHGWRDGYRTGLNDAKQME
jgi:hypothetical protein